MKQTAKVGRKKVTKFPQPEITQEPSPNTIRRSVMLRLDQSLPLASDEWNRVGQLITYLSEFAPNHLLIELESAIASHADDQAFRGYMLGQSDMFDSMHKRQAG